LEEGDTIGIRGPLGNGFPIQRLVGNDLLFIAGGLGIIPLRSLINYVIDNRRDFGKVNILLGCKNPDNLLFSDELESWQKRMDVNFCCTVDRAAPDWKGNTGLITSLIPGVDLDSKRTFAIVVGPPVMYKYVLDELLKKKIPEGQIYLSFERHMKCGVGHCGHCQLGSMYCCKNGPVFAYEKIKNNIEAL
jgi:sulfhydrogenase subunit gamma (sulfur reductase)